jgi:MYXO-CTERM domain-containing protein
LLAFGLGAGAVLWALALVLAAFLVPVYAGEECQASPGRESACGTLPSQTLFAVNGWWVVELLAGVTVVAAVAFWALHVSCATGSRSAQRAAVALIVLLGAFAIVSSLSIGFVVVPLVALLIASAALTPEPSK